MKTTLHGASRSSSGLKIAGEIHLISPLIAPYPHRPRRLIWGQKPMYPGVLRSLTMRARSFSLQHRSF